MNEWNVNPESLLKISGNIWMYWKSVDGIYLASNEQMSESLNLSDRHDVVGRSDYDLVNLSQDSANQFRQEDKIIMANKLTRDFKDTAVTNDTVMHFHTFKMPLYSNNDDLVGIFGVSYMQESPLNSTQYKLLSLREKQCIQYFLDGKTSKQTAAILDLSHRTIEEHFTNIKEKLGYKNKRDLIEMFR